MKIIIKYSVQVNCKHVYKVGLVGIDDEGLRIKGTLKSLIKPAVCFLMIGHGSVFAVQFCDLGNTDSNATGPKFYFFLESR